tara:strand:- start:956 stop:1543 length:588 start_codon:yes stop_codon:yes gene_type:complete
MIIGFLGKKMCGKDTACNYLIKNYEYNKISFAEPLKKCIKELFGFTNNQLYSHEKEVTDTYWGIKPREAMQFIGTDIVRDTFPKKLLPKIQNDFWIKRADLLYKQNPNNNKIVFSDVRFQNEVDYIHSIGGIIVKINRNNIKNFDAHKSEIEIDSINNYDILIDNNSSLSDLYINLEKNLVKNDSIDMRGHVDRF